MKKKTKLDKVMFRTNCLASHRRAVPCVIVWLFSLASGLNAVSQDAQSKNPTQNGQHSQRTTDEPNTYRVVLSNGKAAGNANVIATRRQTQAALVFNKVMLSKNGRHPMELIADSLALDSKKVRTRDRSTYRALPMRCELRDGNGKPVVGPEWGESDVIQLKTDGAGTLRVIEAYSNAFFIQSADGTEAAFVPPGHQGVIRLKPCGKLKLDKSTLKGFAPRDEEARFSVTIVWQNCLAGSYPQMAPPSRDGKIVPSVSPRDWRISSYFEVITTIDNLMVSDDMDWELNLPPGEVSISVLTDVQKQKLVQFAPSLGKRPRQYFPATSGIHTISESKTTVAPLKLGSCLTGRIMEPKSDSPLPGWGKGGRSNTIRFRDSKLKLLKYPKRDPVIVIDKGNYEAYQANASRIVEVLSTEDGKKSRLQYQAGVFCAWIDNNNHFITLPLQAAGYVGDVTNFPTRTRAQTRAIKGTDEVMVAADSSFGESKSCYLRAATGADNSVFEFVCDESEIVDGGDLIVVPSTTDTEVQETKKATTTPTLAASNPLLNKSRVSTPPEKPLYLGLPPQAMNVLLSKGRVVAAVNDPNHGKIKISDQNTPKAGPTRKIQPRLVDGSLVFTFTQADIDFIERGSLQFEVPPELKDRYTSATIEVPEVLNRISQASAKPTQNNSSFQADDSRWKRPGQITARQPIQPRRQLTGEDVAIEGRIALVEARLETEARLEAITAQQYHTFAVAVKAASKAFAEADNERALALLATIDLDLSMLKKASQSAQDLAEPVDQKIAVRFSKLTPASEGTQAEIREDLKQRVAVLFDAKIEAREKALEELAARIASARKKLRDRVENRDSIIDRRVKKLLKE